MPDIGDLSDTYTLNLEVKDSISPAIDATVAKMAGFEDSAAKAAQALVGVGGAMGNVGDTITAVDSQWERLSARNDAVTAASNRLAAAQAILAEAQAASARAIALGSETAEGAAPALQALADKVVVQSAALIQMREATEAATVAQQAWRGAHDQGLASITASENAGTLSTTQATAAREAETVAFAANIIQANKATEAIQKHGISTGETTFIMRQFSLAGVSAFTGLATGAPIMSVLTQSVAQLGYELTLSRHGFTLLKEGVSEVVEALGGWTMVGVVGGVVALTAALVTLGYVSESTGREENALTAQLSGTRKDYEGLAVAVIQASKQIANSTSLTTEQALTMNKAFAALPTVAVSQLDTLDRTVLGLSKSMGTDLVQATTLVTTALKDPFKAAMDLVTAGQVAMTSTTLLTVKQMVDYGDKAGAVKLVLDTMGAAAKTAADQQTPLQLAMTKLSAAFHTSGADGKSWADALGAAMTNLAAGFISDTANLLNNLRTFRDFLDDLHNKAWSGPKAPAVPILDDFGRPIPSNLLPTPTTPTGPISPADPTQLQNQINAAATASNVSAALISALQHFENIVPNAQGNWANSPTGPVGAMQIAPKTFAGMLAQPTQFPITASITNPSLTDQGTNVQVGTELMAHLLTKYNGDVNLAVLAWHDGETVVDNFLKGIGQPSAAAVTESANVIARSGVTSVPTSPNVTGGGSTVGTAATTDVASVAATTAALDAQQTKIADLTKGLTQLESARSDAIRAGDPTLEQKITDQITAQQIAIKIAIDPTRTQTLALTDQAKAAGIVGDADRQLATVQLAIARQRAENPLNPESDEAAAAQIAATTANLAAGYTRQAAAQDAVIANSDALAAKYANGGRAAAELQARQDAVNTAMKFFSTSSPEFGQAVDDQTQRNLNLASATEKVTAAKESANNASSSVVLQTEISTLGQDGDARNALIQHIKDEIAVRQQYLTLSDAGIEKIVSERDNLAQLSRTYQSQQDNLSALSGSFTSAFNTIGDAMAQAFVQGQGAAVNWGNVMKSVIQQVIQKVLELAVLNPILNSLFGGSGGKTLPTLSSVLGTLGSLGGGTAVAATVVGGGSSILGTGATADDVLAALRGGAQLSTVAQTAAGGATTASSGGGLLSGLGNLSSLFNLGGQGGFGASLLEGTSLGGLLGTPVFGGAAAATATNTAIASSLGGAAGPATASEFAAAGGVAPTTLGGLLGGAGAGFGAGSLVGGLLQSALGKTGPAPTIGAGAGAISGALIGSIVPGIGTLIGGLIGGVIGGGGGGLIGPKPPSPFSSTYVGVNAAGQLDLGASISQLTDTAADRSAAQAAINQTNAALTALSVKITGIENVSGPGSGRALSVDSGDIQSIQIGQNSPNGPVDPSKFTDLASAFSDFRFTSTQTDPRQAAQQNTFLTGRSFTDINDLTSVISAVNAFTTDMAAVSAPAKGAAFDVSAFLTSIKGLADADIPAKLTAVDTFVAQTVPALEKLGNQTGSYKDAVDALNAQFTPAIAMAQQLGYQEAELTAVRDKVLADLLTQEQNAAAIQAQGLEGRFQTAQAAVSGSPVDAQNAQLFNFDLQATAQRQALVDQYKGILGDLYASSYEYQMNSVALEKALGEERLAITVSADNAILAAQKAASDQASSAAASFVSSLRAYLNSITVGASSPLSPQGQLDTAHSQFTDTANKALGGDATAMTELQGASTSLLAAGKAFYGSGSGYTALFNEVTGAIKGVSALSPDTLTASFLKAQLQTATTTLAAELEKLRTDVALVQKVTATGSVGVQQTLAAGGIALALADQQQMVLAHNDNLTIQSQLGTAIAWLSNLYNLIPSQNSAYFSWVVGTITAYGEMDRSWYAALYGELVALNAKPWTLNVSGGGADVAANSNMASWGDSGQQGGGPQRGGWIGMAGGGWVANGVWNKDSVLARHANGSAIMLAGGEFVVNAEVARSHARELEAMNPGHRGITHGHMAGGGWVGGLNDNTPVVTQLHWLGGIFSVELRMQSASLIEELRLLRTEVVRLRADQNRRGGMPDRLAS
jgi:hypothetical protein